MRCALHVGPSSVWHINRIRNARLARTRHIYTNSKIFRWGAHAAACLVNSVIIAGVTHNILWSVSTTHPTGKCIAYVGDSNLYTVEYIKVIRLIRIGVRYLMGVTKPQFVYGMLRLRPPHRASCGRVSMCVLNFTPTRVSRRRAMCG